MTQKELLYVEDAIGHEQSIIKIIEDTMSNLEDENLVSFMKKQYRKHTSMNELLLNLLEDNIND